jgi:hypothetical protein
MDMAANQEERDRFYAEYKAFLLDILPPIAEYVSSSEDEEPVANSSLTKSIDEPVSPQPPRNRLPGIAEKWNSDAESVDQNDNGVEHHVEDIHDTNDTSDSGSEGLWGDGNFDNGHDDLDESTQYEPDIAESSFVAFISYFSGIHKLVTSSRHHDMHDVLASLCSSAE